MSGKISKYNSITAARGGLASAAASYILQYSRLFVVSFRAHDFSCAKELQVLCCSDEIPETARNTEALFEEVANCPGLAGKREEETQKKERRCVQENGTIV